MLAVADPLTTPAYDVRDIARLVGITPQRARRWVQGYQFTSSAGEKVSPPLLYQGTDTASFLDLMELVYANAFLDNGYSLKQVRKALEEARLVTKQAHPFASRQLWLSPNDIYLSLRLDDSAGEAELRSLLHAGQTGIGPVILAISDQVVFGDDGLIHEWYPRGKSVPVIIDPKHLGGQPRIEGTRIPTWTLTSLWRAENHSVEAVAQAYGLTPDQVRAAIDFEQVVSDAA